MRVAAIDLGKARVGLAVSDELGVLAHPRDALDGKNRNRLLEALAELAKADDIERFLVGWPLDRSGGEGREAIRARSFAQPLANRPHLAPQLLHEPYSTPHPPRPPSHRRVSSP